jgi:hypothetical protein
MLKPVLELYKDFCFISLSEPVSSQNLVRRGFLGRTKNTINRWCRKAYNILANTFAYYN